MLDPGSFDSLPEELVKLFQELENYVIADVCRRLRQEGYITATAEIRISSLLSMGVSDTQIRKEIVRVLGISEEKLEEMYIAAAKGKQPVRPGSLSKEGAGCGKAGGQPTAPNCHKSPGKANCRGL